MVPFKCTSYQIRNRITNEITDDAGAQCAVPVIDPCHSSVWPFVSEHPPIENCKPTSTVRTRIRDGILELFEKRAEDNAETRRYRCLSTAGDQTPLVQSDWVNFSGQQSTPIDRQCQFVEVEFSKARTITYQYVHTRIEPIVMQHARPATERPDVLVLVLDSVSMSNALRSIPKTLTVLQTDYSAIIYPNLNKIAHNSLPNAYALFNGLRIDAYSGQLKLEDYGVDAAATAKNVCKKPLDNRTEFISKRFAAAGYATLLAEDVDLGVLTWPDCVGFERTPFHHNLRPFMMRVADEVYRQALTKSMCKDKYNYQFDYVTEFYKQYSRIGVPKFSITWLTHAVHGDLNGLYPMDDYLSSYFSDNRQLFDNSFIFVVGDHGKHFGPFAEIEIGKQESNNPMLVVAAPRQMFDSELMRNMAANTHRLLSQFDVYTTIADIAELEAGDAGKFDSFKLAFVNASLPTAGHAESLLRPMRMARNCRTLHIPEIYCLCAMQRRRMQIDGGWNSKGASRLRVAGVHFVNELNRAVRDADKAGWCKTLQLDALLDAVRIVNPDTGQVSYEVTFRTLPNHGLFEAHGRLRLNETAILVNDKQQTTDDWLEVQAIRRLDAYGDQSDCVRKDDRIRHICMCRSAAFQYLYRMLAYSGLYGGR